MAFDLGKLDRGAIVAAVAPGQLVDLRAAFVTLSCIWPGCHHPHGDRAPGGRPSGLLATKTGRYECKSAQRVYATGWRELVAGVLGPDAWARFRADAGGSDGGPRDLASQWAALRPELRWTELYAIRPELSARYLRAGARFEGEVWSDSVLGLWAADGQLAGLKFRLPDGQRWRRPPPGGHPDDKYLCAKGSKPASVVFLADRAAPGATVVVCAGEKDALVAASHLDPARWAPVSGCVGEGGGHRALAGWCRGRDVVVAYDADGPGRTGAARLAAALQAGGAASVRVVDWAGVQGELPRGESRWDVAGLILARGLAGGGGQALEQLLLAAGPPPDAPAPPGGEPPPAGGGDEAGRPTIVCSTRVRELVDQAAAALAQAELGVYQHAGALARVVRPDAVAKLAPLPEPTLLELLTDAAEWVQLDGQGEARPARPPRDVVKALAARGEWPGLPPLDAVVHGPLLRPDGTVCDQPGYDRGARVLYEPLPGRPEFPRVPEQPTRAEALAALELLATPVREFPWCAPSDGAAWLALVLTLVGRPAIDGPVPLFLVRATAPGTGKSKLIDLATWIGTDLDEAARMAQARGRDGDEETKRMLALGLDGAPLALIDNIEEPLGSDVLAAALTARRFKGRVLGQSLMREVSLPVFVATGNNVVVRGDLGRRVVPIDLDACMEHPEQRTGFALDPLDAWVKARRAELRVAALTVLRWFCATGRPRPATTPRFGSYEAWTELVVHALLALGQPDPCAGRQRIADASDLDADVRRLVLEQWWQRWGAMELTTLAIASQAPDELRNALAGLHSGLNPDRLDARRLTHTLRRLAGRIVDGYRLEGIRRGGCVRWQLARPGEPGVELEREEAWAEDAWPEGRE